MTKDIPQIVEILWNDSQFSLEGWQEIKDIDFNELESDMSMRTVGYLIKKTKLLVCIAESIDEDYKLVGGIFTIPIVCIKKIRYL